MRNNMRYFISWFLSVLYLIVGIAVMLILKADGKPLLAVIAAGLFWGPIVIYGIITNRLQRG